MTLTKYEKKYSHLTKSKRSFWSLLLIVCLTALVALPLGWYLHQKFGSEQKNGLLSPFISSIPFQALPLEKYSIENLSKQQYQGSPIVVEELIEETDDHLAFLFSYTTSGKQMTGQLNIPKLTTYAYPVPTIVMLRGWVPEETYTTGTGTKNAAAYFAKNDYVTIAPDFLGYGGSDPEAEDPWEARFQKPIHVIELMESLKLLSSQPMVIKPGLEKYELIINQTKISPQQVGIWAHSNGGQIALTTLEALSQPISTTLWAPVTVPFPYSILFFSDEHSDEGKEQRAWLAMFEKNYDAFDFSLTQHLDKLTGPIQLHHGSDDGSALQVWSDEFEAKIEAENERREDLIEKQALIEAGELDQSASDSSELVELTPPLPDIDLTYYKYPGADHNLQPSWNRAVQRDVQFFDRNLKSN